MLGVFIGLVLGMLVSAALLLLFANASSKSLNVQRASTQVENGRFVAGERFTIADITAQVGIDFGRVVEIRIAPDAEGGRDRGTAPRLGPFIPTRWWRGVCW